MNESVWLVWIYEWIFWTDLFRTPPRAQGMRTSHSWMSSSSEFIASPPLKSLRLPVASLCFMRALMSIPSGFLIAPVMSLTATTFPPFSWISLAAHVPTFPKPYHILSKSLNISFSYYTKSSLRLTDSSFTWITNVKPWIDFPYSARRASVAKTTPRPVAASLPNEPPRSYTKVIQQLLHIKKLKTLVINHTETSNYQQIRNSEWYNQKHKSLTMGFPVTTAGEWPWNLEYSSRIQAMVWALVPMSGAGTSVWIPIRSWIFCVKTRVNLSSSLKLKSRGLHPIPPLAPPYGMSATAVFQVISWASAFTSSGSTFKTKKAKPLIPNP